MSLRGERMLIGCIGGPTNGRLVYAPAPLEIPERGGIYVLQDEGPVEDWRYLWVPNEL